jgi:PTS system, lactose/cellobiose family IIC component
MKKFTEFLQKKMVPGANKFAQIPFVVILRNTVMVVIPLMILGAICTFMTNIPFPAIAEIVEPTAPFFQALASVTSGVAGLATAMAMGYFGAQKYKLDVIFGVITASVSFLAATLSGDMGIGVENFGASGMFTALIVGYISIYILYLCKKYRIEIRMPEGVPPMVAGSFSVIISLGLALALILALRIGLNIDINQAILGLFEPLVTSLNTLPGILLYSLIASIIYICGINPAILASFLIPIFAMSSEANAVAVAAGQAPEQFVTWGMYTIITMGGTGVTLGLVILCMFSKSKTMKTLGRISILPSLFNINEPVVYGFPIMFNPIMLIPFILVPMINISSTWLLMEMNVIGRAFVDIPWTTPTIFNGFLMTGGNIATAIWTGVLVLISLVCYYPFFKIAEAQELAREQKSNEN